MSIHIKKASLWGGLVGAKFFDEVNDPLLAYHLAIDSYPLTEINKMRTGV